MRPKGSGYASQARILEALYREGPLRFKQIRRLLDSDDHKASRNLKALISKGLVKKEEGYRGYSLTSKCIELEKQLILKRLVEHEHDFNEEEFYKWLLNSDTVPKGWEFIEAANDEEHKELYLKYEKEIKEILETAQKAGEHVDPNLLYSWANYLRKIRQQAQVHGARERRVAPKTKTPSPFKPKCE